MIGQKEYMISDQAVIREAVIRINDFSAGQALVLFVLNSAGQVVGSLTDGDIRRGFLKGVGLDDSVQTVMNVDYHFLKKNSPIEEIKRLKSEDLKIIPLIDDDKKIIRLVNFKYIKSILPVDAVIMAGGKGVRLKPYTNDIPKPMLELDKKPIIAHNIDRLMTYGIKNFYISVNHLKEDIIRYLDNAYQGKDILIKYIEEHDPLGTIGSVRMVDGYENEDILVINSDLLTNIDFEDFYVTYKEHNDDMAVATFNIKVDVPYAVFETTDKRIDSFVEKPTYIYYSNAGIYLFKSEHVKFIPKGQKYDAIDLIKTLIDNGKKATHFPIRGYWLDIGTPENYHKAQDDIRYIRF
ncbi:MAG: hypothetical protein A2X47_09230 [Lentisphaerae bacterium GWF2_38_69]|nr:MAG: hypothetical protein A2X47_09230 [Lentisphaerae bacterium GWF2_38_69]